MNIINENGSLSTNCIFKPLNQSDVVYTLQWFVGSTSIRKIQLLNNTYADKINEAVLPRCKLGSKVNRLLLELTTFSNVSFNIIGWGSYLPCI